jgi:hypothetical protein
MISGQDTKRCDNCGEKATLNCAVCSRDMCSDCYHCGKAGLVCGLCLDREQENEEPPPKPPQCFVGKDRLPEDPDRA